MSKIENKKVEKQEEKKENINKKSKTKFRVLGILLLIIVLAFVLNTGRKAYIIKTLNDRAQEYVASQNYHRTIYSLDNGNYSKTEIYKLDDQIKMVTTTLTEEGKKQVVSIYGTKIGEEKDTEYAVTEPKIGIYRQNIYIENDEGKKAVLDFESGISVDPQEAFWGLENDVKGLIATAITSQIKTATYNGEECYYVTRTFDKLKNEGKYVNKNTGLVINQMASEYENPDGTKGRIAGGEYKYEFNKVTKEDFTEPNINEYEIKNTI